MEIDELLKLRELLDAGPKPKAPPDLCERMARTKDPPAYRRFTPMAPRSEIPAFRPARREEPKAIEFAKLSIPPAIGFERPAVRTVVLKPTRFLFRGEEST